MSAAEGRAHGPGACMSAALWARIGPIESGRRHAGPTGVRGGVGHVSACVNPCPAPHRGRAWLLGDCAGAVEDARGAADLHVERDAVVGVARHAGDVGDVKLPGEQGCGAEHVSQAVPGPAAIAVGSRQPICR
jgi:hypothetical protein